DIAVEGIVENLPDAAQVRFAVRCARDRRTAGLPSASRRLAPGASLTRGGGRFAHDRRQGNGKNDQSSQTNQHTNSQPVFHQNTPVIANSQSWSFYSDLFRTSLSGARRSARG